MSYRFSPSLPHRLGYRFKANMKVGGNMYALTQSADEQVRLRACQWWTARRMGWK
jgi:hypothetical protein